MGIEQIRGRIRYIAEVEDWMRNQWSTEVFNFSALPYTRDEMFITEVLDDILHDVVFGAGGIGEMAGQAQNETKRLIKGRRPAKGEQSLGTWLGNTYDGMFKDRFIRERESGRLKPFQNRLEFVPPGTAGPDVFLRSSPMIAWDVTTQADIEKHILRDSIRRLYDRYYLLIWDDPRTKSNTLLKALASGAGHS